MARKTITTLICDCCEKQVEELYTMWISIKLNKDGRVPQHQKDICSNCLNDYGFINLSDDNYISNYVNLDTKAISIFKKLFNKLSVK